MKDRTDLVKLVVGQVWEDRDKGADRTIPDPYLTTAIANISTLAHKIIVEEVQAHIDQLREDLNIPKEDATNG